MSCRLPGADSPSALWALLREGRESIGEVPPDRWDVDRYCDPRPGTRGKIKTRRGGFLEDIGAFDCSFFGIAPREAIRMDPQQRLVLEGTWEAFENGGIAVPELRATRTGVFLGIGTFDYTQLFHSYPTRAPVDPLMLTGNAHSIAANRISYLFDFRGPSLALDTACSSSSLAIHLACQSLRLRESDLAVAGGVNAMVSPEVSIGFSRARMLSGDGRCKAFDERADGYVRSEGCAMLVLKRLSEALYDGDPILGVIRGTAANQDGRTEGITAPNGTAQQEVIREALARAGVQPAEVSYVEAHGTGTAIGDPVEVAALAEIFGRDESRQEPCVVGSVKANVGHTETAAGAVGLIKLLLCLKHELIPRQLHLKELNPKFPPCASRLVFPREAIPWLRGARPRIAGVSSFGFGGTNVHLVVEEPPVRSRRSANLERVERPRHLVALSAKTGSALERVAQRFRSHLAENGRESLADLCFSANAGRAHFGHRVAASGCDHQEMIAAFDTFLRGEKIAAVRSGVARKEARPTIAFLFTGQGAQYPGMGRALYQTQPTFRRVLDRAADLVRGDLKEDLRSLLFDDVASQKLGRTEYTQPALLALEYALAELWRGWGVEPDCVAGHSLGEFAAACVAGVMSLEDALWLVTRRGRFMQAPECRGKMAAVLEGAERVQALIGDGADMEESVSIAALNGPRNTVISGRSQTIDTIVVRLEGEGIRCKWLPSETAFHSPCLEEGLDGFEEAARQVSCRAPRIPLISNLTGAPLEVAPDASYWRRQAREAVRFAPSMERLASLGCNTFLEAGPHPTLVTMGRACLSDPSLTWAASLRRDHDDWAQLLDALASLYTGGVDVDWRGFDREYGRIKLSLPTYPFEREHHWLDDLVQAQDAHPRQRSPLADEWPLLGRRLRSAREGHQFEDRIGLDRYPFLADHKVRGMTVVPAAAYVSLAVAAARQVLGEKPVVLSQLCFAQDLEMRQGAEWVVQTLVEPVAADSAAFRVFALEEGREGEADRWSEHATGVLLECSGVSEPRRASSELAEARSRCREEIGQGEFYTDLARRSLEYGPAFQTVRQLWRSGNESVSRIEIRIPRPDDSRYPAHPLLLDGCFQSLAVAAGGSGETPEDLSATYLPRRIERIAIAKPLPETIWCHCWLQSDRRQGERVADLDLYDDFGNLLAEIRGLHLVREEPRRESAEPPSLAGWLYETVWSKAARSETTRCAEPPHGQAWLVLADRGGVASGLAARLAEAGGEPWIVYSGDCFQRYGDRRLQIDPGRLEDLHKMVETAFSNGGGAGREICIAHLWALDAGATVSPDLLARTEREAWGGVLGLLQIFGRMRHLKPTHLYLVTRNVHALPEDEGTVSLSGSLLWGLGRVAGQEYPGLQCIAIDLGVESSRDPVDDLALELMSRVEDDQVALRAGRRFAARLRRLAGEDRSAGVSQDAQASAAFRDTARSQNIGKTVISTSSRTAAQADTQPRRTPVDAAYVIAGGCGGMELHLARWLVERGIRTLVILGRRGASAAAEGALEALRAEGIRVRVASVDIADRVELARVLDEVRRSLPPIRGVIHAANVTQDGPIHKTGLEEFSEVLASKVQGAWNLHQLTLGDDLDLFLLCSSIASVIGSPGQATRAAANAFVDGLARYRRSQGLCATAINWSAWVEGGLLGQPDPEDLLVHRGLGVIEPEEGLRALDEVLSQEVAQAMVAPVDWSRFLDGLRNEALRRFAAPVAGELAEEAPPFSPAHAASATPDQDPAAPPPEVERLRELVAFMRAELAAATALNSDDLDPDVPLADLGVDSLVVVELVDQIETSFDIQLPLEELRDDPTLHNVARLAATQLGRRGR